MTNWNMHRLTCPKCGSSQALADTCAEGLRARADRDASRPPPRPGPAPQVEGQLELPEGVPGDD